jgi:hypothetical protein
MLADGWQPIVADYWTAGHVFGKNFCHGLQSTGSISTSREVCRAGRWCGVVAPAI